MSNRIADEDLTDAQRAQYAKDNHIWLNAFSCINPTDKFKQEVGEMILNKLDHTDLRATKLSSGKEPVGNLIYVRINKS